MQTHPQPPSRIIKTAITELTTVCVPDYPTGPHTNPPRLHYFYDQKGEVLSDSAAIILEFCHRQDSCYTDKLVQEEAGRKA